MRKFGTEARRTLLRRQQASIDSQVVQESTALSILGQPGYELVTLLSPDTYYVNKARAGRKL
ncbi:MAG: hypothetical protein NHB14_17865 [Desulfosporosinus sp.]|nr:hypothetical protein [Desulfosporosinus sp.]